MGGQTTSSFASPFKELPAQKLAGRGGYYGGHGRRDHANRTAKIFTELSMSHEEKALRNNYGANFESGQLTLQQSSLQSPVKLGRALAGTKLAKSGRTARGNDASGRKTALAVGYRQGQEVQGGLSRNVHSSAQLRQAGLDLS